MQLKEVCLHGRHVHLEPLRPEHANELWPDAVEPGLFQHMEPGLESTKRDLQAWIAARLVEQSHGAALPFLQRDAGTRKAFGCTAYFNVSAQHHRLEVGHTWLGKSHRKTPANTEAKLLMLTHAFETMGAVRVQFKADTRNEAAIRALERIGAVREGLMRSERILADGFIRDAYVYSIIDREWPDVKTRLNGLLARIPFAAPKREPPRIPGLNPTVTPPPGTPVFAPYNPRAVPSRPVKRA